MKQHLGALLDEASYNIGDLDLDPLLSQVDQWQRYSATGSDERLARLQNVTIAVINKVRLDAELIDKLPNLRLVLLAATGTDNVDLEACRAHGITVCNVIDYCTSSVAQHVFALMLALANSLGEYADETASGGWSEAAHFATLSYPIVELEGKTLGLVGYGTLAKGVEKLARAFGMRVLLAQRAGGGAQEGRIPLQRLLAESDFVSLHCPLLRETYHLINADSLDRMKNSAFLINTSRGAVVDNAALAKALREGKIAGAGIDVLETEPPPADHPLLQADVPNVIVTPHVAWARLRGQAVRCRQDGGQPGGLAKR